MSKEFRIGLIALVSGAILYYGFNYLKGIDFFTNSSKYYVIYRSVDGLNKSNPVIVNGLSVGKVNDIQLMQSRENAILVELMINSDIVLGDSTVAELSNTDFLGSKAIVLKIGDVARPLAPMDTLIPYVDRGLEEYLDNVTPITNDLSITISRINEILLGLQGAGQKINATLDELQITMTQVNDMIRANKGEIERSLVAARELIESAEARINQLDPILTKTEGVLDSVAQIDVNTTLNGVNQILDELNETLVALNNGQGTLGQLMTNDSLYNNLNQAMIDLDRLIIHFDQYPKDFLKPLGRKNRKLKGGETGG